MSLSITNRPLRASWIDVACSTQLSKIFRARAQAGSQIRVGLSNDPELPVHAPERSLLTLWVIHLAEPFARLPNRAAFVKGVFQEFSNFFPFLFNDLHTRLYILGNRVARRVVRIDSRRALRPRSATEKFKLDGDREATWWLSASLRKYTNVVLLTLTHRCAVPPVPKKV